MQGLLVLTYGQGLTDKIQRNTHGHKHRNLRVFPVAVREETTIDIAFYAGGA